jgi:hypothetical protein
MVRTGKRALALAELLDAAGLAPDMTRVAAPRIPDLDAAIANDIVHLYRELEVFTSSRNCARALGTSAWAAS